MSIPDIQMLSNLTTGLIVIVDQSGRHTIETVARLLRMRSHNNLEGKIYLVGDSLKPEDIWPEPRDAVAQGKETGTLIMRQNFILDLAQKMKADVYVITRLRDEREFVSCLELAMCGHLIIVAARAKNCGDFITSISDHIGRLGDISMLAALHSIIGGVIEIMPEQAEGKPKSISYNIYLPSDLTPLIS
ncbi:hypothetical protein [Acetobacter syzygii]|uniref:Uncharacterized protein n=1 Tax=Acetobacter syzygii TaxID=146476 RepID=A0A270B6D6_9PROT|nr:hypothetical protein [Acetobacter syzygii]NSL93002.1 hypothetical protein [Acetobacter syzygii]PAL20549.1 hypothetical protein B9K05_12950 [Acetobacter syzygii]PAL21099.1 hypothetical protein B9K04_13080 [Acetobacter syzygii]